VNNNEKNSNSIEKGTSMCANVTIYL